MILQLEERDDERTTKIDADAQKNSNANQEGRWGEIKSKINVDPMSDPV
jgi:hypothetical protein